MSENEFEIKTRHLLATLLTELESELRLQGCWELDRPSESALSSSLPFAIDTLSFTQWLQFIFIEKITAILQLDLALPSSISVSPMADEYFKKQSMTSTAIRNIIVRIDLLIDNNKAPLEEAKIEASTPDLTILYQDEFMVAVDKPSGLLVHRSWLDPHATEFALKKVRDQIGKYVYPVHRLDRPTSGILLFALDKESAAHISEQFSTHHTEKRYLAVVRGHLGDGELDYALQEKLDKIADKRTQQDKPAQSAFTQYRCLRQTELPIAVRPYSSSRYSLMELTPKTGRKHQLRRHMAHLRHPIICDTSHGDGKHNAMFRDNFACQRLLLHAAFLALDHPKTGERIEINAPLDDFFSTLLIRLKLEI